MKRLLLNCDQVFEVLTRGPFPTGEPEDVAVEQHLRACHDCRQLAEALRPAISLLHEAVAADEAIDLPEYQGSLPWKRPQKRRLSMARLSARRAAQQNQSTATQKQSITRGQSRQPQAITAVRYIAASLLVAALGLLLGGTMLSRGTRNKIARVSQGLRTESPEGTDVVDGMPTAQGLLTLASLKLPAACVPLTRQPRSAEQAAEMAALLADGSLISLRCCTECHHAGEPQPKAAQLIAINRQNCQACHRT